jgi:hypothetical protein
MLKYSAILLPILALALLTTFAGMNLMPAQAKHPALFARASKRNAAINPAVYLREPELGHDTVSEQISKTTTEGHLSQAVKTSRSSRFAAIVKNPAACSGVSSKEKANIWRQPSNPRLPFIHTASCGAFWLFPIKQSITQKSLSLPASSITASIVQTYRSRPTIEMLFRALMIGAIIALAAFAAFALYHLAKMAAQGWWVSLQMRHSSRKSQEKRRKGDQ